MNNEKFKIRLLDENDSLDELTAFLHECYTVLADAGLRFLATHQDTDTTRRRIEKGECYIIKNESGFIATVCYYPPGVPHDADWYKQPGISVISQFAVAPRYRRLGIGSMIMDFIEKKALADGANEVALDTSEKAGHLINYYSKRGYRFIEYKQWSVTNYRSVILSKKLLE
jgi:GNAT superfamily N-acetyltransferase